MPAAQIQYGDPHTARRWLASWRRQPALRSPWLRSGCRRVRVPSLAYWRWLGVDMALSRFPCGRRTVLEKAAALFIHEPSVAHLLLRVYLETGSTAGFGRSVCRRTALVGQRAVRVAVKLLAHEVHRKEGILRTAYALAIRNGASWWRLRAGSS